MHARGDGTRRLETGAVGVGSRVRIRGARGVEEEVTIVADEDGMGLYRLSPRTPLGRALLGRRAGDAVTVQTDAGGITFQVVRVDR